MKKSTLRVSLVIPAYNEERHLRACLDGVAAQTEAPFEVIVVDNNSTDATAEIAASYSFVRVVHEPRVGIVFARNAGFDAAHGDIIARIDADVVAAPDWVARVRRHFEDDQALQALTGVPVTLLVHTTSVGYNRYWSQLYMWWTGKYFGVPVVCGANFAMRRKLWRAVRPEVCLDAHLVHEDQDLSVLVAAKGIALAKDTRLNVFLGDNASYNDWSKFTAYVRQRWRTKAYHVARGTYTLPIMQRGPLDQAWDHLLVWGAWSTLGLPYMLMSLPSMYRAFRRGSPMLQRWSASVRLMPGTDDN